MSRTPGTSNEGCSSSGAVTSMPMIHSSRLGPARTNEALVASSSSRGGGDIQGADALRLPPTSGSPHTRSQPGSPSSPLRIGPAATGSGKGPPRPALGFKDAPQALQQPSSTGAGSYSRSASPAADPPQLVDACRDSSGMRRGGATSPALAGKSQDPTSTYQQDNSSSIKAGRLASSHQSLNALLVSAINAAAAEAHVGAPEGRDPHIAANLTLDAHRQVLTAFVDQEVAGPAFTPLLQQIQASLDGVIRRGLQCGLAARELRAQLAAARQQQRQQALAARSEVLQADAPARQQLQASIAAAKARSVAAQRRADAAKKDLAAAKEELGRLQVQQRGLRAEKAALAAAAAAEQEWLSRPGVAGALGVEVPEASPVEYQELLHELAPGTRSSSGDTDRSHAAATAAATAPSAGGEGRHGSLPGGGHLHPLQEALQLLEKQDVVAAGRLLQHYTGTKTSARTGGGATSTSATGGGALSDRRSLGGSLLRTRSFKGTGGGGSAIGDALQLPLLSAGGFQAGAAAAQQEEQPPPVGADSGEGSG